MRCTILFLSCLVLTFRPQEASSQNPAAADWPAYARDYGSTGYAPLSEIKPENVSSLKQICSYSKNPLVLDPTSGTPYRLHQ